MTARSFHSILITGASSGIGAALAEAYAGPGTALFLSGRDAKRLATVAAACEILGADVEPKVIDVTDAGAMAAWIDAADRQAPLDLVIANAGVSGGTSEAEGAERVRRIFDVNVQGVINTVEPALAAFRNRGHGQVGVEASIAAFRGMPGAPTYSASKAAAKAYGEAMRIREARAGIGVSVICPGFVTSRITDQNRFAMPFLMAAPQAARIIHRGLARNRGRIAFPWPMYAAVWLLAWLPLPISDWVLSHSPEKE